MRIYQNHQMKEMESIPEGTRIQQLEIRDGMIFPSDRDPDYWIHQPSLSLELRESETGRTFGYGLFKSEHYQSFMKDLGIDNVEQYDGSQMQRVDELKGKIVKGIVPNGNGVLEGLLKQE